MYIPLISLWLKSGAHNLERRKGGGGGKGSGESSGGKSSGSGAGGGSATVSITSASGSKGSVHSYGSGSTKITTIPVGQPFSSRTEGGGTRDDVFGTRQYGSGYPGTTTPGTHERGFPFGFWPVIFGSDTQPDTAPDFRSSEYGDPTNSSRPGGPLFNAPFQPTDGSNTYRVLSDNMTVQTLIASIVTNCSLSTTSIAAVPYNTSDPTQPKPEQIIQYYRSSSIALALDGYNNSAVYSSDINATDTPLPSTLNGTFLDCLNQTIGAAAPLLDTAIPRAQISSFLGLTLVVLHILRLVITHVQ